MISSDEIRAARERAGLTQQQLGELVGVGLRTVGNWERGETVPRNREAMLRRVLAGHLDDTGTAPLRTVADAEVVAEVARRMSIARERERRGYDAAATTQAGGSPAAELDAVRASVLELFKDYVRDVDNARRAAVRGHRGEQERDERIREIREEYVTRITETFAQARGGSSENVG